MNILEKIVADKRIYVDQCKRNNKIDFISMIEKRSEFRSLKQSIINSSNGIIAEFKRKSPSKGFINAEAMVENIIPKYEESGVAGISVLTDTDYFGGKIEDLIKARALTETPILRKDFIIDEYQIYEAGAIGADAILLIGECLTKTEVKRFSGLAKHLNLDVLFEVHSESDIESYNENIDIVGVNNRDLKSFKTDITHSLNIFPKLPK